MGKKDNYRHMLHAQKRLNEVGSKGKPMSAEDRRYVKANGSANRAWNKLSNGQKAKYHFDSRRFDGEK